MSRIRLWLAMMILWSLLAAGRAADNPCLPSGPPDTNCLWQALVKVLPNMTIDPAVQATNRPFDSITCVGLPIKASGPAYGLVTNGCQVIFRPQEPARCGDLILGTTYPVPTGVTWNWTIADDGTESGQGDEVEFTRTNATAGSVAFEINQVLMPPDSKCPGAVHPDYEAVGRSFAFVAVDSLAPEEGSATEIDDGDNDPNTRLFLACGYDSGFIDVYATPTPDIPLQYLPDCWTLSGGSVVNKLHTKVSLASAGQHTVTATANTSSKTAKIIVLKLKKEDGKELWWFNGEEPPNYLVRIEITAEGVTTGTFHWDVAQGSDKIDLVHGGTRADSITVQNNNKIIVESTAKSDDPDDVTVELQYTVGASTVSCMIDLTVFAPNHLWPLGTLDGPFPPGTTGNGWMSIIYYEIRDQFNIKLPAPVPWNEDIDGDGTFSPWLTVSMAAISDYPGENWIWGDETGATVDPGSAVDAIIRTPGTTHTSVPPVLLPPPSGPAVPIDHSPHGGGWYVGSATVGRGVKVSTTVWQIFQTHARHH